VSSDIYSVLVSSPLFFTTWVPPKSLSQVIPAPKRSRFEVQNKVQNKLPLRNCFFSSFCRFCDFLHTTSSASRIAPATSKPHFRLSSFLLFLLSLRPCFRRLFGSKWVPERNPNGAQNRTSQKGTFLRKKNPVFQKGVRNGSPKGEALWSARLFYVASLFFARFWSLPSLLWKIICPHFRILGLDFLVFSRLQVSGFRS